MGQCQAAVAEAVAMFGKLDILLCCSSEGLVTSSTACWSTGIGADERLQPWSAQSKSSRLLNGHKAWYGNSSRPISLGQSIASRLHYQRCGKGIVDIS